MQSAPQPNDRRTPTDNDSDEVIDAVAVAEFSRRLDQAIAVQRRRPNCAAAGCEACALRCVLWFVPN